MDRGSKLCRGSELRLIATSGVFGHRICTCLRCELRFIHMGYVIFAIALGIIMFIIIVFLSKSQVHGSDEGLDESSGPQSTKKPNEEFIDSDPTHNTD